MAAAESRSTAIAERIDRDVMHGLAISEDGRVPAFASMTDVLEFAKVMAVSGIAIRGHLRNNPGACAAVIMQAQRWAMDPFTVGNKSYAVNDQLAFESQLIAAVINTRAPIVGRLKTRFEGQGNARKCIAWATFRGDTEPTVVESPPIGNINPKNSPLWKTDPDQQLSYYTKRLWARRECPEVLLGVYDPEELDERGPERARDVTPARPTRQSVLDSLSQAGIALDSKGKQQLDESLAREDEPEPWEFTDADGEVIASAESTPWAAAFLAALRDPAIDFARKQGVWETNSPMLPRLREAEGGTAGADAIHAAMVAAMQAEDERAAKERAAAQAQSEAKLAAESAAGESGAAAPPPDDSATVAQEILTEARQMKKAADIDALHEREAKTIAGLPQHLRDKVREELEKMRRLLIAADQPAQVKGPRR